MLKLINTYWLNEFIDSDIETFKENYLKIQPPKETPQPKKALPKETPPPRSGERKSGRLSDIQAVQAAQAVPVTPNTPITPKNITFAPGVGMTPTSSKKQCKNTPITINTNVIKTLKLTSNYDNINNNLTDMDIKKILYIKKYIYPMNEGCEDVKFIPKHADGWMFGMFLLTKGYKIKLLGEGIEEGYEKAGKNISNIIAISALEIFHMKPYGFNLLAQGYTNFLDFINYLMTNQQEKVDTNKIVTTFDTVGKLPYLTNITPLLKKETIDDIDLLDLRTPAKTYDSAWMFDEIFSKDKKTITIYGNTHYDLFFEDSVLADIYNIPGTPGASSGSYPFCKFSLLDNGLVLKLYQFGNYHFFDGLETGSLKKFAPKSSSKNDVAIKIVDCYNELEQLSDERYKKNIIRYLSFFKFGGDFIQGIWQYILSYPSEFQNNRIFQQFYTDNKLAGLKLHIATDGLSAIITSLFGGLVVTSNTQFAKLEGLSKGATEFFFVKKQVYDELDKIYKEQRKIKPSGLTTKRYTLDEIKDIMIKTAADRNNDVSPEEIDIYFDPKYLFGKSKKRNDLNNDFKYLLTLNEQ
jgi:hypothetical protein